MTDGIDGSVKVGLDPHVFRPLHTDVEELCATPGVDHEAVDEVQSALEAFPNPRAFDPVVVTVEEITEFIESLNTLLTAVARAGCGLRTTAEIRDRITELERGLPNRSPLANGTAEMDHDKGVTLDQANYKHFYQKINVVCGEFGISDETAEATRTALRRLPHPMSEGSVTVSPATMRAFMDDFDEFLSEAASPGCFERTVEELEVRAARIEASVPGLTPRTTPDEVTTSHDEDTDGTLTDTESELERLLSVVMDEGPEFFYTVVEEENLIRGIDANPELEARVQHRIDEIRADHDTA